MTFPFLTSATAGAILLLQVALGFSVSAARNRTGRWLSTGGDEQLLRLVRRHGNLAENSAIFIVGLALAELAGRTPAIVAGLCVAFLLARVLHVVGLSRTETRNFFRLAGSLGTTLIGIVLGGTLLWIGAMAFTGR